MILHTVNKSPFQSNCLESCLRVSRPNTAILLIEDGVYAATGMHNDVINDQVLTEHTVYALAPDLKARGLLERVRSGIKLVDYEGFVELTERFKSVQSWY